MTRASRLKLATALAFTTAALALTTSAAHATTYVSFQGELRENGALAQGPYDVIVRIFVGNDTVVFDSRQFDDLIVTDGRLRADIILEDPPTAAIGITAEISVRPGNEPGQYRTLGGRNAMLEAPRATHADTLTGTIASAALVDGAVDTAQLAPGAVDNARIAGSTIEASRFAQIMGDVTAVTAGQGLAGGGPQPIVLDRASVQARTILACAPATYVHFTANGAAYCDIGRTLTRDTH